ncbi:UNVERIFIED_CONTAM: hypothetical protein FKN15_069881 [Acipenser sinensis]
MLAEGEVNGNWTPQEKALHEARLKAKAKRRLRRTLSRDSTRESFSETGGEPGTDPNSPKGKISISDRKSRMGKGRGLPKKGGAGGNGWGGAAGMVYDYEEPDARDPNYDESSQGDTVYATVVPELDEEQLEKTVNPIVQEYFQHGDTKEALLKELNLGSKKFQFSSLAVSLALEGKASHRELTSRLLSDLTGKALSKDDISRAFDKMLKDLPELILDTPEAPQMLGQFIARAIADHALPMNFLDRYKGRVDCDHARAALDRAAVLLSMKREIMRLDNVWGVGGGQRPVRHLIREAVVMVLESSGETAVKMMVKLLKVFWETGLITIDQMNRGFQRVYDELPDINLDVPHAHTIMEKFVDLCFQETVITKQLRDACPCR